MRTIIGGEVEILVDLELKVTLKDLDLIWVVVPAIFLRVRLKSGVVFEF